MSEFTKDPSTHPANGPLTEERLIRVRDELAAAAKRSDGGNLGYMMADAAKAIDEVLAYRDAGQEPVAIVDVQSGRTNGDKFALVYCPAMHKQPDDVYYLYAAPQLPQPAVLEWTNEQCLEFLSIAFRHAEIKGDLELDDIRLGVKIVNDSRAGAEPVSQPYKLPDDTRRLDWLDAQNNRLNDYYGTAYGWKFDANFQRNAMMLNDSNYPVMTVRQAIDEAMAAAPQQDVK